MDQKELNRIYTRIRSTTIGPEKIKVVYLGKLAGFHFGHVIVAEARFVQSTGKKHPYPKYRHCSYRIDDEDGDAFEISKDGINFYEGFYPVPDYFDLGPLSEAVK